MKPERPYAINNPDGIYFITFATVYWIDIFTRKRYKEIVVESLKFCQENKGLEAFAWCLMSNHIHLILRAKEDYNLSDILRDFNRTADAEIYGISIDQIDQRRCGEQARMDFMDVRKGG